MLIYDYKKAMNEVSCVLTGFWTEGEQGHANIRCPCAFSWPEASPCFSSMLITE